MDDYDIDDELYAHQMSKGYDYNTLTYEDYLMLCQECLEKEED